MKKFGFTLAEVLITLAIIGVVAALTIPTLMTNYQKKETVTKLQKAYAEIYQALKISEAKYGDPENWIEISTDTASDSLYFLDKYLAQTINISEKCEIGNNNCWGNNRNTLAGINSSGTNSLSYPTFTTHSGYSVLFWVGGAGQTSDFTRHYQFKIDVNGKNKPNIIGKDTFQFTYLRQTNGGWMLVPFGYYGYGFHKKTDKGGGVINKYTRTELLNDTNYGCSKSITSTNGSSLCATLIYEDGWHIKEDYPW